MSAEPIEHPALERARLHRRLSTLVERLITILDDLDGDPDLEDGDEDDQCDDEGAIEEDDDRENEASLCGVGFGAPYGRFRSGAMHYDLEVENACEDTGDGAPDDAA